MPSNITAYEWPLSGTIHIAYETGDEHIHEMSLGRKGTWRDDDITRVTGAPELEDAILTGASWQDGHTQQIAYASAMNDNVHIYQLVMYQDHPWSLEDPMLQPIDAAPADGFALVSYEWKEAGTKQLVYSGRDEHIHELSAGVTGLWRHTDLTEVTGAPLADNSLLAAYAWEGGHKKQVVYVDSNHHLFELHISLQESWKHTNLTQLLGLVESSHDALAAHEWTQEFAKHIAYLDTAENPHIHSLILKHGEDWKHADVTSLTGAQPIV